MTKVCTSCKTEKNVLDFYKDDNGHLGYRSICKACLKVQAKKYRACNCDKISTQKKEYYIKNKNKIKNNVEQYKKNNPEKISYNDKIYNKKRMLSDDNYRIKILFKSRIRKAIKNQNARKNLKTNELLGCSPIEAKMYLESLFQKGMTWENHGVHGWHIDHIIPCASFDLRNAEQQKECFRYTNLQPLWAIDNLKKSDKLNYKVNSKQ